MDGSTLSPFSFHTLIYKGSCQHQRLRKYDEDGNITNVKEVLGGHGFVTGASVIRKDKTIAKITGFNGEFVLLSTKDGPLKTSYKSFLNHEWGTFKAKNAVEFLTDLEKISFMKSEKGKIEYIKAAIQCEVWTMARQETGLHWLQMSTKPKNVIVGPTDIAKGKLRLYPCTWQVVQKAKGASPSANVVLGEYLQGFEFSLAPVWFNETDAVGIPFWHVSSSHDPSMANMVLKDTGKVTPWTGNPADMKIKIPFMTNTTALAAGTVLCIYKEKPNKTAPALEALAPVPKRLKGKHAE